MGNPSKKSVSKEKALNAQELSAIIRLCREQGVSELKYGDLNLRFDVKVEPVQNSETHPVITKTSDVEISETPEQQERALLQEELKLRERQLDELLINDPLRAEQLIEAEELVEDDTPDLTSDDGAVS